MKGVKRPRDLHDRPRGSAAPLGMAAPRHASPGSPGAVHPTRGLTGGEAGHAHRWGGLAPPRPMGSPFPALRQKAATPRKGRGLARPHTTPGAKAKWPSVGAKGRRAPCRRGQPWGFPPPVTRGGTGPTPSRAWPLAQGPCSPAPGLPPTVTRGGTDRACRHAWAPSQRSPQPQPGAPVGTRLTGGHSPFAGEEPTPAPTGRGQRGLEGFGQGGGKGESRRPAHPHKAIARPPRRRAPSHWGQPLGFPPWSPREVLARPPDVHGPFRPQAPGVSRGASPHGHPWGYWPRHQACLGMCMGCKPLMSVAHHQGDAGTSQNHGALP